MTPRQVLTPCGQSRDPGHIRTAAGKFTRHWARVHDPEPLCMVPYLATFHDFRPLMMSGRVCSGVLREWWVVRVCAHTVGRVRVDRYPVTGRFCLHGHRRKTEHRAGAEGGPKHVMEQSQHLPGTHARVMLCSETVKAARQVIAGTPEAGVPELA